MAEIIDLNKKLNPAEVKGVLNTLSEAAEIAEDGKFDIFSSLGVLLEMSEENFALAAPGVLQSYQMSINNPNDRIALVQALNAIGTRAEDLEQHFIEIVNEINNIDFLSKQKKDFLKQLIGTTVNAISETEGIAKRYIQIPVELCHEDAKMPQYANISDSGMDVYAIDDYTILPGETKLVPTGIKLALPPGYEIQVRPKSGRALKTKLRVANTPGTVDAGYRDEICVIIENIEPSIKDITYHFDDNGKIILDSILHGSDFTIGKGEKFCQLVLSEVPKAALYRVESVSEIGENRGGGFGSTGLK